MQFLERRWMRSGRRITPGFVKSSEMGRGLASKQHRVGRVGVLDDRQNGVNGLEAAGLAPAGQLIEQGQQGFPPLPRLGPQHLGAGRRSRLGGSQTMNIEEIAARRPANRLPIRVHRRCGVNDRVRL